jgi:hypothetical protein
LPIVSVGDPRGLDHRATSASIAVARPLLWRVDTGQPRTTGMFKEDEMTNRIEFGRAGLIACVVFAAACSGVDPAAPEVGIASEAPGDGWHFGPYVFDGDPTDEGTCGAWAIDSFQRSFNLVQHPDGTLSFVTNDDGTFVTLAGPSPDACDPATGDHGEGRLDAGITGHMHGKSVATGVHAPSFNLHGCDNGACRTCGDFAVNVLGAPNITVDSATFVAEYVADPHQNLAQGAWHNASPEYGGNHGDIRSTP